MKTGFFLCCLLMLASKGFSEEPWGPDVDLLKGGKAEEIQSNYVAGSDAIILFHQQIISPADGPRSHFIPSSSSYALQSIRRHGFVLGFLMGCDRLMRENSEAWIYPLITTRDGDVLKWDPAP